MKKIKPLSVVAFFVTVFVVPAFSQGTQESSFPEKLPVGSLAQLKAFALDEVEWGYVYSAYSGGISVQSPGQRHDENYFWGENVSGVLDQLNSHEVKFKTSSPRTEKVEFWASLNDADGYAVLTGQAITEVNVDRRGNASISPNIDFRLADFFPLNVGEDVVSGQIRVLGKSGWHVYVFENEIHEGRMWIPISMVGVEYEFVLTDKWGNSAVYKNGIRQPSKTVTVDYRRGFSIEGFTEIVLNSDSENDEYVMELSQYETSSPQVFQVDNTACGNWFILDISLLLLDGEIVRPKSVQFFVSGHREKIIKVSASSDGKFYVNLPPGATAFVWPFFHQLENPPFEELPGKG
jgi:hypothetical protein